jgi:hypothetical protein
MRKGQAPSAVLFRPLPDRLQAQELAPAPKVASFALGLVSRPLSPCPTPSASRSPPVILSCRLARSRSSPVKLKKGRPISGNPPSLWFLPCVSFVGCRQDTRGVTSGHQGGVSTTGGGCQPDVGWGVRTTPGPGQRNQSRTPGQFPVLGRTGSQSRAGKRGRPTRVRRASMVHANRPTDGVYAT